MSEGPAWLQLHGASVVVNLVPRAWRVLRTMWPIFLAVIWGSTTDAAALIDAGILLFFFLTTVGSTVFHWATLRYRVHGGRLEIRTGLLNRQVRAIDAVRIQDTELVRNVFHKLSGLVEVRIETASGTEVEGLLSALGIEEAEALVGTLDHARRRARPAAGAEPEPALLVASGFVDLFRYGITSLRLGAVAVLVGLAMEGLQWAEPDMVRQASFLVRGAGAVGLVVAVLTGTWLGGVITAVLRHHRFQLLGRPDSLVAEGGLLTRRRVELPLSKVQLVSASEPLLRRWAGIGSVRIETAAARADQGGTRRASALVPVVETARLPEVVRMAVPRSDIDPWVAVLRPPHPHALYRALAASSLRGLVLAGLVIAWFWPWGLLAAAFVPVSMALAWLDYKHQGWAVADQVVVARRGWWHRRTAVVSRDKLQSVAVAQGPMRRRWGLARLSLRVAGSAVALPDMDWDEALGLLDDLRPPGLAQVAASTPPASPPPGSASPAPGAA